MKINNKKLILSLLVCSSGHNLFANDWAKGYFLKLSSGALLGGFGAVVSGFSVPIVTLGALAGSWISNAWQSNNQLQAALGQANNNIKTAIKSIDAIKILQIDTDASLTDVERFNCSISEGLHRTNQRFLLVEKEMRACSNLDISCAKSIGDVEKRILEAKSQIKSIEDGLFKTSQLQQKYNKSFKDFVIQDQKQTMQLFLLALLQKKLVARTLQQQDSLQLEINQRLNDLNAVQAQAVSFAERQATTNKSLVELKANCESNLLKQGQLEAELLAMIRPKLMTIQGLAASVFIPK